MWYVQHEDENKKCGHQSVANIILKGTKGKITEQISYSGKVVIGNECDECNI